MVVHRGSPGTSVAGMVGTETLPDRIHDHPAAVPVDMASLEAAEDVKRHLLDSAAAAAATLMTGQAALPAGVRPADAPALMRRFYAGEPAAEVVGRAPEELAALALDHLRLAARRTPGTPVVDLRRTGQGRAVLRVVVDDMPFLVDSVTAEVVRQGIVAEHVVHPIVVVRRDPEGGLTAFCDSADAASCGADALSESWMAVVLAGDVDEEAAGDLAAGLATVLADVRRTHEDADALTTRALEIAAALDREPPADDVHGRPADDPAEAAALLRWLTEGNFLFLGARTVELVGDAFPPTVVEGSELGLLRGSPKRTTSVAPAALAAPGAVGSRRILVTKGDARSTVQRPAWLDLVVVDLPSDVPGSRGRQYLLVGLLPNEAYISSVRDVPLVRRIAEEVLARSGVPADSHSGKELLDVLETYPRDELLQVDVDELLPVALAVLHLRERRQTRLFLRRDPFGRFFSALVYLPRDRYTTEVRQSMQQLLLERLGGTQVEFTVRSSESLLTRLHFVVRVPVSRRGGASLPEVDVPALEAALAAATRSWTDDLADALAERYGAEAPRMLSRVADASPAAYQEDFPAAAAVEDLARLELL